MSILPPVPTKSDEVLGYMKLVSMLLCGRGGHKHITMRMFVDNEPQVIVINGCGLRCNEDYTDMEFFVNGKTLEKNTIISWYGQIHEIIIEAASHTIDGINVITSGQPVITLTVDDSSEQLPPR